MGYFEIHIIRLLLGFVVALSLLTFPGEAVPLAPVPVQDGVHEFQSMVIPAKGQKAGEKKDSVQNQESDESWNDEDEEEEPECPRRMYYHIQGKRCVPLRCPGGNKQRNKITGECKPEDKEDHYRPLSPTVWHGQHRGQFRHQPAIRVGISTPTSQSNGNLKELKHIEGQRKSPDLLETKQINID